MNNEPEWYVYSAQTAALGIPVMLFVVNLSVNKGRQQAVPGKPLPVSSVDACYLVADHRDVDETPLRKTKCGCERSSSDD